ncbi:MAG: methylated-DNA--[protein]-cysteine S-methyltransferase [Pseudomonadales bacterium]|nr:methylated-DNA--[protein]-cysteine S-methyltransferase [Pseudomonadales bacterium]
MSDYERIARAIQYLRSHTGDQPSLAAVAEHVHLSEYHFQRLFRRWAGVTPKRYLQALTLARAKQLLADSRRSLLATSDELGLSSSSRLYDHFVQLEAVTPSEFRQRGAGMTITWGVHATPFGPAFVALTPKGVCQFEFVAPAQPQAPLQRLLDLWHQARVVEDQPGTAWVVARLLAVPAEDGAPLSLWVQGTNFQVQVWRALLQLAPGHLASYRDVAVAIGRPTAARAVGTAIGANPVALAIPCHRVLRQGGELGGYRWGETRKQAILARELARADAPDLTSA